VSPRGEQAQPAGGHAFPARVVDLAGQLPGLLEGISGLAEVVVSQVELGPQDLRPGLKAIQRCSCTNCNERSSTGSAAANSPRSR
jgi:hypothetical protein